MKKEINAVKAMNEIINAMADKIEKDESQKELFTGGRWRWEWDSDPLHTGIDILSDNGEMIVDFVMGKNLEEAKANAALIVASKDMYYTLKITNQNLGNLIQWMDEGKEVDTGEILSAIRNDINGLLKKIHP